ncbi:class I SAM-dependent methyltransferase [Candidatus Marinarcus aquaticus]|uniref:Methyltransferase type 11 n=1 Tax=Candidatus Marinarcus aquaticus TaxID=2044504 RepID=A0A4Q0XNB1_9BACT|nr:class I SAM-dependent methyltransferase [Candidatus Marinarcus aquaticus]RXJ55389.1 methyltransferase type 11 [Candidatus Marinarcus aquaticus]
MESEFIIPDSIKSEIEKGLKSFRKKYSINSKLNNVENILNGIKYVFETHRFKKFNPSVYKEIKYLEIGVGLGGNLINSLKAGYDINGIEPSCDDEIKGRYQACLNLMIANGIKDPEDKLIDSVVENLPFSDESYDFVFSIAVLEHVKSVREALKESYRVLKRGGVMYMNIPNYDSFYEGHYDILWLPYLLRNKKMARLYLKLRGRDPSYLKELNFTRPDMIMKIAKNEMPNGTYDCYPHITGFLSVFGLIYFAFKTKTSNEFHVTQKLSRQPLLYKASYFISMVVVKTFMFCGFAKTFNFIYFKEE